MAKAVCHRCGERAVDYCGKCGTEYCQSAMAAGCCGERPALSGCRQWEDEQSEAVYGALHGDLGLPPEDVVA